MKPDGAKVAAYDLHLHTCWSYDATAQAETYFRRARELGVRCIAVTDHHVMDALGEVLEAARGYPEVRAIPAAELTVTTSLGSVDLLCYGFPSEFPREVEAILDTYHEWQRSTGAAESAALQALGLDYTDAHRLELLRTYRPPRTMALQGNTHVKNEVRRSYFLRRGFIAREEDYKAFMAAARDEVSFPPHPKADDVVPVVKRAGALVAIAHPRGCFDGCDLSRIDTLREECGLDGVECGHKGLPEEERRRSRDYCLKHGMYSVGGSDCHSDAAVEASFARHGGEDEWLDEFLERLDGR